MRKWASASSLAEGLWRDCRGSWDAARALEVLLSADDIRGADAELLGYVNRALPDAELDTFVDALANRIASFDKWAIANTKRLVNEASLPPDVEIESGMGRLHGLRRQRTGRRRKESKTLLEQGLQQPGDVGKSTRVLRGTTRPQRRALKSRRPISLSERKHTTMDSLTIAREIADRVELSHSNRTCPSRLPSSTFTARSFSPTA